MNKYLEEISNLCAKSKLTALNNAVDEKSFYMFMLFIIIIMVM